MPLEDDFACNLNKIKLDLYHDRQQPRTHGQCPTHVPHESIQHDQARSLAFNEKSRTQHGEPIIMSYNGWKNYETWNVALWIGNDEGMYNFAKECGTYKNFVDQMREVGYTETPDKVAYNDSGLDLPRLEEMFADL